MLGKSRRKKSMSEIVIPVAHDFTCPWCWIGLFQAKRLKAEFGVKLEWLAYELCPAELGWPEPRAPMPVPANKPPLLSRLDFLKLMDSVDIPKIERPKRMHIHDAHEAVEFVKQHVPKATDAFVEDLYRAYWERGERIGEIDVITDIAAPYLAADNDFERSITSKRYAEKIIGFDAPAYATGVFNVPTFWIGGERYAEQPYMVLERAMKSQAVTA